MQITSKCVKVISILLVVSALLPLPAFCASPWTEEATYADKITKKLEYGFLNLLAGWTELYQQPASAKANNKTLPAAIGTGIYHFLGDTLGGTLHVLTFPFTFDIPLPDGGLQLGIKDLDTESDIGNPAVESSYGR